MRREANIVPVTRARPSPLLWLALAALAVFCAVGVWKRAIRPHVFPKNFGVVEAGQIYRSGELSPEAMRRVVADHGIKTVIDFGAHEAGSPSEMRERRVCDVLGVERYQMRLEGDSQGNANYYVQALRLMNDPAKRPILVHCAAGSERTGCAVILYRHVVQGKPIDDVYHEAYEHRHSDDRNPKLRWMLDTWAAKVGAAYRDGGLIPDQEPLPDPVPVAPVTPAR